MSQMPADTSLSQGLALSGRAVGGDDRLGDGIHQRWADYDQRRAGSNGALVDSTELGLSSIRFGKSSARRERMRQRIGFLHAPWNYLARTWRALRQSSVARMQWLRGHLWPNWARCSPKSGQSWRDFDQLGPNSGPAWPKVEMKLPPKWADANQACDPSSIRHVRCPPDRFPPSCSAPILWRAQVQPRRRNALPRGRDRACARGGPRRGPGGPRTVGRCPS